MSEPAPRRRAPRTRVLPAPGEARAASTSTASATPPSGPTCSTALKASGRRNYSLFLRDDGLLIGYVETADDRRTPRPRSHATS